MRRSLRLRQVRRRSKARRGMAGSHRGGWLRPHEGASSGEGAKGSHRQRHAIAATAIPAMAMVDSRAAPAAREPWPPTRRSPRRLPQALTRPRHAAVSKTGPDGMRVRIAAIWW